MTQYRIIHHGVSAFTSTDFDTIQKFIDEHFDLSPDETINLYEGFNVMALCHTEYRYATKSLLGTRHHEFEPDSYYYIGLWVIT